MSLETMHSSHQGGDEALASLDLHPRLRERITQTHSVESAPCRGGRQSTGRGVAAAAESDTDDAYGPPAAVAPSPTPAPAPSEHAPPPPPPFALYLPTVLLRLEHNPAFALACRLANRHRCALVVLATVLDDSSVPPPRRNDVDFGKPIVMTARRLAFQLEALSQCAPEWSERGAAVAVRVHGPGCRTPDHLTLAGRAIAVVADEPFVHPFLGHTQRVERACRAAGVPCYRVDGSATVPPASVLRRRSSAGAAADGGECDPMYYDGLPRKAYIWQRQTERLRMGHVRAAMEGHFDAPDLLVRIDGDDFLSEADPSMLWRNFPTSWRDPDSPAPGTRPWTAADLSSVPDLKAWSSSWPGADPTVPPCSQTIGTTDAGLARWASWRSRGGLEQYRRRRNDPRQPHAPSRMSCYLNVGAVSVFRIVAEVKEAQAAGCGGADKFEEEIVKWREYSYAHCLSRGDHGAAGALPGWAARYLDRCGAMSSGGNCVGASPPSLTQLEAGRTGDAKWNAMQRYLVATGELHNNARMTWGKTVVHWCKDHGRGGEDGGAAARTMRALCYLNDRFALDGLSPPSYAGLLWCAGWTEKPTVGGAIGEKPAHRYRVGPEGFQLAESRLIGMDVSAVGGASASGRQTSLREMLTQQSSQKEGKRRKIGLERAHHGAFAPSNVTLHSYFDASVKENDDAMKQVVG